ncbi:hypothetical protein IG631_24101 [Alternaria alternata]|nr:hypothetical protein IG631_24101 [Alternaria alternata]
MKPSRISQQAPRPARQDHSRLGNEAKQSCAIAISPLPSYECYFTTSSLSRASLARPSYLLRRSEDCPPQYSLALAKVRSLSLNLVILSIPLARPAGLCQRYSHPRWTAISVTTQKLREATGEQRIGRQHLATA